MTGAEIAYLAARILSCGIWVAAGLHKAAHYEANINEMAHLGVPLPASCCRLVLVLEIVGAAMLIFDYAVWAAALAWLVFLFRRATSTISASWSKTARSISRSS